MKERDETYSIINETRLKVLRLLKDRSLKHSEIRRLSNMTHSNSFHHLNILLKFDFIIRKKEKLPIIKGKGSYFDLETMTKTKQRFAYFYELTKKGVDVLNYFEKVIE
jgi:DNA-binding transcriptional ArsR family regulator